MLDEKTYPLEYIISEETLTEAIKLTEMTQEDLKAVAETIVSLKVSAQKK